MYTTAINMSNIRKWSALKSAHHCL